MKYKHAESEGWYYQIDDNDIKSQSWNKKNRPVMYAEMVAWVEKGNEIEPRYNAEELGAIESDKNEKISITFISERNARIKEADKWELPTILKRNNITIEQVEVYKQTLCDMPETHTTTEQLENPEWPEKLITQELL